MQGVEKGLLKASDIPAFPTTKSTDTSCRTNAGSQSNETEQDTSLTD